MLGSEYEIRTERYYRKNFQIQSDETLTDAETLFFASAIILKFKFRRRKLDIL